MIALLLGLFSLLALMAALGMFSRARVVDLKQMAIWVAAIGGLLLAVLLLFTGRAGIAVGALVMLGPLIWSWVLEAMPRLRKSTGGTGPRARSSTRGGMSRAEALEVLGLQPGATASDIQTAYVRLMRAAHPDQGGSDWLAARINQARDVLS